jgi:sugar O-acyltransferase (sialic acid O-acetyltransferase NeuD family)
MAGYGSQIDDSRGLYVVGTRTFAAEVVDFARDADLEVLGLVEPYDRDNVGRNLHGLPVTWLDDGPAGGPAVALTGTGEPERGELVARLVAAGWRQGTLVHPRAHVAPSAAVGAGSIVGPGVVVGARATIGDQVMLGRGALVGHHTELAELSTIGPGANLAGNVRVGAAAHVAMGAMIRDHVTIGAAATVAMGAVVVADVPRGVEVRGVPARPTAARLSARGHFRHSA